MRAAVIAVVAVACTAGAAVAVGAGAASHPAARSRAATRPNIVFVLTDDLSWNLLPYMPHVQAMRRHGATFSRYFVTDSLCCPSRSSIFSGRFPHDTGVFTNTGADGGFDVFHSRGEERHTFATALHAAGYRTAMTGKYLNGYEPAAVVDGRRAYTPPGWDEWDVAGNGGYAEFDYNLAEDGRIVHYGSAPQDYLTEVLAGKGTAFIDRAAARRQPFMLEIATFAPHKPSTPAPRDAGRFPNARVPRTPAYHEADVADKPPWLRSHPPLTAAQKARLDVAFRKRVRAVQAVDRMIGRLEDELRARGVARDTYLVFSSDNGYHMGDHRLLAGKMTAFETDIRVPLIVVGPGVAPGRTLPQIAENVDLAPTFEQLGGAAVPASVDGHSLLGPLRGNRLGRWRDAALVEHHGPDLTPADPDFPEQGSGNPPSYEALRLPTELWVEYADGEREHYDLRRDPFELRNDASRLSARRRAQLHRRLAALERCHSGRACWRAGGG